MTLPTVSLVFYFTNERGNDFQKEEDLKRKERFETLRKTRPKFKTYLRPLMVTYDSDKKIEKIKDIGIFIKNKI